MKTKKVIIALLALGAYFSSNAQNEWIQVNPLPTVAVSRYGSISVLPASGTTGYTTYLTNSGISSGFNGSYQPYNVYSFGPSGLDYRWNCFSCGYSESTIGSGLFKAYTGNPSGSATAILTADFTTAVASLSLSQTPPSGVGTTNTLLKGDGTLSLFPLSTTTSAISIGTGSVFTVSPAGNVKTIGTAIIGATAQDGTSALTVPSISYTDASSNSYKITPTLITMVGPSSSQNAPHSNISITSGGINIASLSTVPFNVSNPNTNLFKINSDGSVVIGSSTITTPGAGTNYKLYVEKGILTEKVKVAVKTTSDWSDFVFANDYKLKPLKEVEKYITANKHLPDVASASEMVSSGLDVAKTDAVLLQKVEELTLYIIELQKQIDALKK